MDPRAFDTHKAVKALKVAGFSDPQAEAVVETVGTAMGESLATKTDLELALQPMMTKADLDTALKSMASKTDLELALQPLMTKADDLDTALKSMASKTDLDALEQRMITKAGLDATLKSMASKADLAALEQRMTIKLGAMVVAGMSFLAVFQKVF